MDILFWSGGKDSYLALEFYRRNFESDSLKLLTTYKEDSDIVPFQNIPVREIKEQAAELGLDIVLVPLPHECPNDVYLEKLSNVFQKEKKPIRHLIFGDWRLEDIREWRESAFGGMGYTCIFPIWQKSIDELLPVLLFKPVRIEISAIKDEFRPYLRVGEVYNQQLVRQLPPEIDPMGENGEFHTRVIFQDMDDEVK